MGAFIAKQPNGLYCRYSEVVDNITHHNMTEEEYIELCADRARREAWETLKDAKPFSEVLEITADDCKINLVCKSVAELQHALRLAKVGKEIVL